MAIDKTKYGQDLTEATALSLAIQKLRELEEIMGALAQLRGDARWLTLANLYGQQAREQLPALALKRLL